MTGRIDKVIIMRVACKAANAGACGAFTLIELLVVIGIIAILAAVVLGPITRSIKQAQESASVQVAHQMGAIEFAYSNDFNQFYPYGGTSEALANVLLNGGYATNPNLFEVAGTPNHAKYTGASSPYNLTKANVDWDYVINGTPATGLSSSASDLTPLCQLTGSTHLTPLPTTAGTGLTLTINPALTAFGADGIAVYYKGNNAVFIKCTLTSATTATNTPNSAFPWVGTQYADPLAANYALVQP